jgi:hypothetical protein
MAMLRRVLGSFIYINRENIKLPLETKKKKKHLLAL